MRDKYGNIIDGNISKNVKFRVFTHTKPRKLLENIRKFCETVIVSNIFINYNHGGGYWHVIIYYRKIK